MRDGAPIRFLVLMLGGWALLRLGMIAPEWWSGPAATAAPSSASEARPSDLLVGRSDEIDDPGTVARWVAAGFRRSLPELPPPQARRPLPSRSSATPAPPPPSPAGASTARPPDRSIAAPSTDPVFRPVQSPWPLAPRAAAMRRWSGSAWLLARRDGGTPLAPGGTLGGSQAGGRLFYRINGDPARPLALSARLYAPLRRTRGAEVALGLDWRPGARIPVHVLIERRQRLGSDGRSAFSAIIYGGGSAALGRGWRLDGYAQAGIVGTRSRDAFVDASARVSRPVGPIELGGAAWGTAQPGASRLDIGPHVTLPMRTHGASLHLSAEYRFRVAGDARPASGPALTLGVDF